MSNAVASNPHTRWDRAIAIALAAVLIVAVVLLAFTWPSITSSAKNIPVVVSGPPAQVEAVTKALDANSGGVFAITTADSRDAAIALVKSRDADGAIILGPAPEVLTASANGPIVSQILGQVAGQLQAQANQAAATAIAQAVASGKAPPGTTAPSITVKVSDVVPLASTDARGTGLLAAAFPLVLGGMLGGILISLLVTGVWRRLTSVVVYSCAAGLVVSAIMQGWFGVLQGNDAANAAAMALSLFATSAFIVGMNALIGTLGIPVGSVVTMLIGNPMSSATQPVQFMVEPWGAVGQWFVPGASATLLRDLSYFPEANATFPWLVLAGWALLGTVFMVAGHFRGQEVVHLGQALEPAVVRGFPAGNQAPPPAHGRHQGPAPAIIENLGERA